MAIGENRSGGEKRRWEERATEREVDRKGNMRERGGEERRRRARERERVCWDSAYCGEHIKPVGMIHGCIITLKIKNKTLNFNQASLMGQWEMRWDETRWSAWACPLDGGWVAYMDRGAKRTWVKPSDRWCLQPCARLLPTALPRWHQRQTPAIFNP